MGETPSWSIASLAASIDSTGTPRSESPRHRYRPGGRQGATTCRPVRRGPRPCGDDLKVRCPLEPGCVPGARGHPSGHPRRIRWHMDDDRNLHGISGRDADTLGAEVTDHRMSLVRPSSDTSSASVASLVMSSRPRRPVLRARTRRPPSGCRRQRHPNGQLSAGLRAQKGSSRVSEMRYRPSNGARLRVAQRSHRARGSLVLDGHTRARAEDGRRPPRRRSSGTGRPPPPAAARRGCGRGRWR